MVTEKFWIYFFYFIFLSLMLTITEQILFTIKNSNKILIDINTLVKKPIEQIYIKNIKDKIFQVLLKFSYIILP